MTEANERALEVACEETGGYLAEGIHTAFRKATDCDQAHPIWKLIQDMPDEEWGRVVSFIVEGFGPAFIKNYLDADPDLMRVSEGWKVVPGEPTDEWAEKVAGVLKEAMLRRDPMMDEVAVKLNRRPTYEEIKAAHAKIIATLAAAPEPEDKG